MHAELEILTQRLSTSVGAYRTAAAATVATLSRPIDVVDSQLPVSRLELIFRSPHVESIAVQDAADPGRIGLITRPSFTAAMTGRLGFGRAVLARRAVAELADWSPMVVSPDEPVSQVAVRAMDRPVAQRYDDVLVAGQQWRTASTSDLVRSLSTLLAVRSLHDPLTGLGHRSLTMHGLERRCAEVRGTGGRVVVVLLDLRGFARINQSHGQSYGDVVLTAIGTRLGAAVPPGCDAGRTAGDEFTVVASLPGGYDDRAAAGVAEQLRRDLLVALEVPAAGLDPDAWPQVHSVVVLSEPGAAAPDSLVRDAQSAMRAVKDGASAPGVDRAFDIEQ